MTIKTTQKQQLAIMDLLKSLKDFSDRRYGSVNEIVILTNKMLPNVVLIKYEKSFVTAGERDYEYRIASIDQEGNIEFIDSKFKDVFDRSAFLSECKTITIEDLIQ